jgi:hypothetical protein
MTISNWTSRSLFAATILVTLSAPTAAFAAINIVDVMYDPPGADSGHEWIEVSNTGTDSVNLASYRLFEAGTNHKLTVTIGTSTLPAGAKAIIATDPMQYKADHPSFAGAVFKSSFSLSNTGETIEIKDASLAVVDSYSYVAPPVVKEPAPAKALKATKVAKPTKTVASTTTKKSATQAAAVPLALPTLPAIPSVWLYGLGLAVLLILGAGATLYAKPASVTQSGAGEFELE